MLQRIFGSFGPRLSALAVALVLLVAPVASHAKEASAELKNLRTLASDFYKSGAYDEGLIFSQQALDKTVEEFGANSAQASIWSYGLGLVAEKAKNWAVAVKAYKQSVAIRDIIYGENSPGVAQALERLGVAYLRSGQHQQARSAFARVLQIRNDLLPGMDHPFKATAYAYVASADLAARRLEPALAGFTKAVELLAKNDVSMLSQKFQQDDAARKRFAFVGLARAALAVANQRGRSRQALIEQSFRAAQLAWRTSAASAIAKMTARLGAGSTPLARDVGQVDALSRQLTALREAASRALAQWSKTTREYPEYKAATEALQKNANARFKGGQPFMKQQILLGQEIAKLSSRCAGAQNKPGCEGAMAKLKAMTAQMAELARRMREAQGDVNKSLALIQRLQAAERAIPGFREYTARRQARIAQMQALEAKLNALKKSVAVRYPSYNALVDPKPLPLRIVQDILGPEEALVMLLAGGERSYVWAVTRERIVAAEIKASETEIGGHVSALRLALDPLAAQKRGAAVPFDVARAHKLYKLIFGQIETALIGKTHMIFVPTGPMTSLPAQVLVTRPPAPGVSPQQALADAQWLIKRSALSVLPSVQSLQALRLLAPESGASRAFIGIGDPDLKGTAPPSGQRGAVAAAKPKKTKTASLAASRRFYRGSLADVRAVSALTPLPDTAVELKAIARVLGAKPEDLLLRDRAREPIVRTRPLQSYRIVHFATHGLVSGELSGLAEPALVLTPPSQPSPGDDGLLTASEIVTLSLDAEWVVLSACNTAAGNNVGAEALSGLARAFFFAGARALLVSHWSVYSDAAVKLTTRAFSQIKRSREAGRGIGRAEALRRAMLSLIAEGKPPGYWAPFVVVGDGSR